MGRYKVVVVGAGIIGVSTAVKIQTSCPDADVTIIADKFSPNTTSDGAAGYVLPYLVAGTPAEDVRNWCSSTLNHLMELIKSPDASKAGVHFTSGYNCFKAEVPDPDWKDMVLGFRHVNQTELNNLFPSYKYGWFFTSIICESHRYIPFLTEQFQKKGGDVIQKKIGSLGEFVGKYDVVVNCTGMMSRFLVGDDSLEPVRGQVIRVHAPWIFDHSRYRGDADGMDKYNLYARQEEVVVGGTAQRGRWDTTVDPADAESIWKRACNIVPSLKSAKIISHWVGLRPSRSKGVRVESETMTFGDQKLKVVHNYGHGGSGITLHWGCAEDAAKLVKKTLLAAPPARL